MVAKHVMLHVEPYYVDKRDNKKIRRHSRYHIKTFLFIVNAKFNPFRIKSSNQFTLKARTLSLQLFPIDIR